MSAPTPLLPEEILQLRADLLKTAEALKELQEAFQTALPRVQMLFEEAAKSTGKIEGKLRAIGDRMPARDQAEPSAVRQFLKRFPRRR